MKYGPKSSGAPAGFTIVETLIVLAVTGFLFVSIAMTIGGRQRTAAFQSAAQDIRTQIQQTISDVASGYFPSNGDFKCTASATSISITTGSGNEQGTNGGCVFLGKVMEFGTGDPQPFTVDSVAGLRTETYKGLDQLDPTFVSRMQQQGKLRNGLTLVKGQMPSGTGTRAVAFLYSLGKAVSEDDGGGVGFANGAQQVNVFALEPGYNSGGKLQLSKTHLLDTGAVKLCFASGGTKQWALITIGNQQGTATTSMTITSTEDCGL